MKKKWKKIHDLKVYLVYRKIKKFGEDKNKLCKALKADKDFKDIKIGSIDMRVRNYLSLSGKGRLNHVARQSKEVFKEYEDMSINEIEESIKKEEQ